MYNLENFRGLYFTLGRVCYCRQGNSLETKYRTLKPYFTFYRTYE